jgi:hypothetical protein
MFSTITMAWSTSIPLTITKPMIEIRLMVTPKIGKRMKAQRKENGMPTVTMMALRKPTVNHRTATTSTMPTARFESMICIRSRTKTEESQVICASTPSGRRDWKPSANARTLATMSLMSASGSFDTPTMIVGSPLWRP